MLNRLLCWLGSHHWNYPGGHCIHCHVCDEFLGKHEGKFLRMNSETGITRTCNGDTWSENNGR